MVNVYEAARKSSVSLRIVFASTHHTNGFYPTSQRLDVITPPRPDSLYAVSKVFGEALARMFFDKFSIETASIRIGLCSEKPTSKRQLSIWMSHGDFISLIESILQAPRLDCPVFYGVSANTASWWDNGTLAPLSWRPKDNAEDFRAEIVAACRHLPADHPNEMYHGGYFCTRGIIEG